MNSFKPTFNFKVYRVTAVDIADGADELARITISATRVKRPQKVETFDFLTSHDRRVSTSVRLQALLGSLGVRSQLADSDEMIGRYFAVRDGGTSPEHFATLEYASACLQADRERYFRVQAYLADCAAEEAAVDIAA